MKRPMVRQIVQSLTFTLLLIAGTASAQKVLSTKAGVIQYVEGNVFWEGKPLQLSRGSYSQMGNGQSLRTVRGRAELLLNPNVYLRLGENSSLRMEQNELSDVQLALENGSALIEVVEDIQENGIRMLLSTSIVKIRKAGLYRLYAESHEVRVYGGTAETASGNRKITIKKGRMIYLDGTLKSVKFDANVADSLHKWAASRSFSLFDAAMSTRRQMHWTPIALGWLYNANFRMRFYSPLTFNELIKDQERRQADALLARAAAEAAARAAQTAAAQAAAQASSGRTPNPQPTKSK